MRQRLSRRPAGRDEGCTDFEGCEAIFYSHGITEKIRCAYQHEVCERRSVSDSPRFYEKSDENRRIVDYDNPVSGRNGQWWTGRRIGSRSTAERGPWPRDSVAKLKNKGIRS